MDSTADHGEIASSPGQLPLMQPVTFKDCFGWLHMTSLSCQRDTAIVLCQGLSQDAGSAYRSFRLLANHLGALGYPTLRYDYPCTGDSCDVDNAECWSTWERSVHAAADWLLSATQTRQLVLIGLRAGATLAALAAAARDDVAGVVLLEPVLRGKSYVTQLLVEARMRDKDDIKSDGSLSLNELRLSAETIRLMADVDLRLVTFPDRCSVAVFSHSRTPVLEACLRTWEASGSSVTCASFDSMNELLRPSHLADDTPADFAPVLSWIQTRIPAQKAASPVAPLISGTAILRPGGCIETPIRFGAGDNLFGMLCCPDAKASAKFVVIIVNTGGNPHHGFARFGVEFARALATQGIASLRMDFAGLGDSANDASIAEDVTHVFNVNRRADIGAAVTTLQQMGFTQFAVNGLCSGAYHALQGALADKRISALLVINLPLFTLRFDRPGPNSEARRNMTELSRRDVRTLLVFSAGDAGIKALERHFGSDQCGPAAPPGTTLVIEQGLDHDLTGHAMRRLVADRMIHFLQQSLAVPALRDHAPQPHQQGPYRPGGDMSVLTQELLSQGV